MSQSSMNVPSTKIPTEIFELFTTASNEKKECFNQLSELEKICEVINVKNLRLLKPLLDGLLEEEDGYKDIEELIPLLEFAKKSPLNLKKSIAVTSKNFTGHSMTQSQQHVYELAIKNIKKSYSKETKKFIFHVDEIGKFGVSTINKFENRAYDQLISQLQSTLFSASKKQLVRWEEKLTDTHFKEKREEKLALIKMNTTTGQIGLHTSKSFKEKYDKWKKEDPSNGKKVPLQIAGLNEMFLYTEEAKFAHDLKNELSKFKAQPKAPVNEDKQKWTIRVASSHHATLSYFAEMINTSTAQLATYVISKTINQPS